MWQNPVEKAKGALTTESISAIWKCWHHVSKNPSTGGQSQILEVRSIQKISPTKKYQKSVK